jgi:hypothetical protein
MREEDLYTDTNIVEKIRSSKQPNYWHDYLHQQYHQTIADTIEANLLKVETIEEVLDSMIERTVDVSINILQEGHYRSHFAYLFNDDSEKHMDAVDYLTVISRIICIEKLGTHKRLYESFISELVHTEIVRKNWISFFVRRGSTEDQAKDLFQNSFLVLNTIVQTETPENYIINKPPTFKGLANLTSYLYSIGKNKWREELKKLSKFSMSNEGETEIYDLLEKDVMDSIIVQEQYEQDLKLLEKLGGKCKEVLLLLAEGYSLKESLTILAGKGIFFENENALKQQRHRCKNYLMDLLT